MYDQLGTRPRARQAAALQGTDYYFLLIRAKFDEDEDWVLTRGGVAKGSKKLLQLKEYYRNEDKDTWLSLHTSINQEEMATDLYTHLGITISDNFKEVKLSSPPKPGVYENFDDFLKMLSVYGKYCLFYDSAEFYLNSNKRLLSKKSITLLVDSKKSFEAFAGIQSNSVRFGDLTLNLNLLDAHSGLPSPAWAREILSNCRIDGFIKTPSPIDRLFAAIYFLHFFDKNPEDKKIEIIKNICGQEGLFKESDMDLFDMRFWLSRLRSYLKKSSFSYQTQRLD